MRIEKYRDPIHGFIEVSTIENKIIDSPPFQRLRNIKQLAMTNLVYHGAEHTRFGHSIGVMHLATRAFNSALDKGRYSFTREKKLWYEQILRLIALTHDLGHAPFSHASESLLPKDLQHEDYTTKIIKETCIADYIDEIGNEFVNKYGEEYDITPELICDIYNWHITGENSEFTFLNSFMDSEMDCDKMDYLLRDSLYCGVNYGKYDLERLLSSLTIYSKDNIPRLAIEYGGVQALEEFVLARYFMFIQVYFHRTRRYFDIMLVEALKDILPNGTYPADIDEYLKWDDHKVLELIKENANKSVSCNNIVNRIVYPAVIETKPHPQSGDSKYFQSLKKQAQNKFGIEYFIEDYAAKMPHKIPTKVDIEDEKAIIIINKKLGEISTITEESHIINSLTEKIDIKRLYADINNVNEEDVMEFIKRIS